MNEEIHARLADIGIKMANLTHAYEALIDELADKGLLPVRDETHHKMPEDPELGDAH